MSVSRSPKLYALSRPVGKLAAGTLLGGEARELAMSSRYVGSARLMPQIQAVCIACIRCRDFAGMALVDHSCLLWHAELSDQASPTTELRFTKCCTLLLLQKSNRCSIYEFLHCYRYGYGSDSQADSAKFVILLPSILSSDCVPKTMHLLLH